MSRLSLRPSPSFVAASWSALAIGSIAFCIGLINAGMELNEKGYYLTVLAFGLFAVVSLQKSVRDRMEHVPVSAIYFGACWVAVSLSICLLVIGLWNADLALSEKGFYGMAFTLSLFGVVTVQKNVRDLELYEVIDPLDDALRGGRSVAPERSGSNRSL